MLLPPCVPVYVSCTLYVSANHWVYRPLYRDLYRWEDQRQTALNTFNTNKDRMMAVSRDMVAKDLMLGGPEAGRLDASQGSVVASQGSVDAPQVA